MHAHPTTPDRKRRSDPLARRNCVKSTHVSARCDTCGKSPDVVHMPLRWHGFFCAEHCPSCSYRSGNEDIHGEHA